MIGNAEKNGFIVSSNNKITQEDIANTGLDKLLGSDKFVVDKRVYYDFFGALKDKINGTSIYNSWSDPEYERMGRKNVYVKGVNDKDGIGKLINWFVYGYKLKLDRELGISDPFVSRSIVEECGRYLEHNLRLLSGLESHLVTANCTNLQGELPRMRVACVPSRQDVISALCGQRVNLFSGMPGERPGFCNIGPYKSNKEIRTKMLHGLSDLRKTRSNSIKDLAEYKKNAKQRLKDEEESFVLFEKLLSGDRTYMDALYNRYDSLSSQENVDVNKIIETRRKIRIAERKLLSSKKEVRRLKKLDRLSKEYKDILEKLYTDSDNSLNGLTKSGTKYKNYIRIVEDAMLSGKFEKLGLEGLQSKMLSFAEWDRQLGMSDIENSYVSLRHNLANTNINIDNVDFEKVKHVDARQHTNFTKEEKIIVDNLHNKEYAKGIIKNPVKKIRRSINKQFKDGFHYYCERIIKPAQYIQDQENMRKERAPEQPKVENLFAQYAEQIQEEEGMTM